VSKLHPVSPPSLARTAEFAFEVSGDYENPYDPDQIKVDARVTGPAGRSWNVPAFWMEPCAMRKEPTDARFVGLTYVQFYIRGAEFPREKPVSFTVSGMALRNSANGRQRVLSEWMVPEAWTCRKGATVTRGASQDDKPTLVVTIVPTGTGYPGIHLIPSNDLADWSAFDTLEFQAEALAGLAGKSVALEVRKGKTKYGVTALRAGRKDDRRQECSWRYDRHMPVISWAPPSAGGWRLRIAAPKTGNYTVAVTATDRAGTAEAQVQSFYVAQTTTDGFIRVAPEGSRYLCYDSGKPTFSVGTNLLVFNDDFAEYHYYIDRFTNVGVNLFRVWLNVSCLGFEKSGLVEYGPGNAPC